ncbi:polysaccharide biosynthesis tyrosine autokinase [Demequina soli]|uniref:polysaccharide biosynthesis tyrosine autokinase n=1 Tax=Demequina soli TaxID=1638987 RepID=UPI000786024F|nr:polysaccharide biosynthesis tyrosine autokinase [Demequina soli]
MELKQYTRVFRARWKVIVLLTLLGGVLSFAWSWHQPKIYTSTGSMVITAGTFVDVTQALEGSRYIEDRADSYLDIARSRKVAGLAADQLGTGVDPDALLAQVGVSNAVGTAVLRVTASAGTPQEAQDLAQAWMDSLTTVVAEFEDPSNDAPSGANVVGLQPLDPPSQPVVPSSPNLKFDTALGLLLGLFAGVAYALIRNGLDDRIREAADVERTTKTPVLGSLPHDSVIAKSGVAAGNDDFAMREAVRQLRTNLQFLDVDHPPRVLVITSAMPGDGKSTTSVKLAEAIAEMGRDVVLIDADLRRPSLATNLGLVEGAGLTDVLAGRVGSEDVIQPYGGTGHLSVLAAGAIPPNPSELLASDAMHTLVHSFPDTVMVLIDTPPLLPVTDAALLTARTDGALLVVRSGKTTTDMLEKALEFLMRVKGRALGVIVDGVPRKGAGRGSYAYAYEDERQREKAPAILSSAGFDATEAASERGRRPRGRTRGGRSRAKADPPAEPAPVEDALAADAVPVDDAPLEAAADVSEAPLEEGADRGAGDPADAVQGELEMGSDVDEALAALDALGDGVDEAADGADEPLDSLGIEEMDNIPVIPDEDVDNVPELAPETPEPRPARSGAGARGRKA